MDNANYTKIYMESVLDGFEGAPYKRVHMVQLHDSLTNIFMEEDRWLKQLQ